MQYAELRRRVAEVKGVGNDRRADELIREIAEHLVGSVDETLTHDISGTLPSVSPPKQRRHPSSSISAHQYINQLSRKFDLQPSRTEEAIRIVLQSLKAQFSAEEVASWRSEMPDDWIDLVGES